MWRVFSINAVLLVIATLLLGVARDRLRASLAVAEGVDVAITLAVMLTANFALLQQTLQPLERLIHRMGDVDVLRPGQRLAERGGVEVAQLVRVFNQMLDGLEAERRTSGARAIRAQEAERARIARGLHDEVGQALTGVLLQLESRGPTEETKAAVRQALEEVRRIAHELRPQTLEHLGLTSALTELSRKFAALTGIGVERRLADDLPRVSEEAELVVYRVAQESLTNAARHANASRIELSLESGAGSIVLRVIDDGRGPTDDAVLDGRGDAGQGQGLRGMRERALLVGGALAVKPASAGGVEVRLEVPTLEG